MEPVPLQSCIQQLQSLNYSPIIGNTPMSQESHSKIPSFGFTSKSRVGTAKAGTSSLSSSESSSGTKKRLFIESNTSPVETSASKHQKMNQEQLDQTFEKLITALREDNSKQNNLNKLEFEKLSSQISKSEQNIEAQN